MPASRPGLERGRTPELTYHNVAGYRPGFRAGLLWGVLGRSRRPALRPRRCPKEAPAGPELLEPARLVMTELHSYPVRNGKAPPRDGGHGTEGGHRARCFIVRLLADGLLVVALAVPIIGTACGVSSIVRNRWQAGKMARPAALFWLASFW